MGEKFCINSKKVNTISTYVTTTPHKGISPLKKFQEGQYLDADF